MFRRPSPSKWEHHFRKHARAGASPMEQQPVNGRGLGDDRRNRKVLRDPRKARQKQPRTWPDAQTSGLRQFSPRCRALARSANLCPSRRFSSPRGYGLIETWPATRVLTRIPSRRPAESTSEHSVRLWAAACPSCVRAAPREASLQRDDSMPSQAGCAPCLSGPVYRPTDFARRLR